MNNTPAQFIELLQNYSVKVNLARQSVLNLTIDDGAKTIELSKLRSHYLDIEIYNKLLEISKELSDLYLQIIADFEDEHRLSWAGTSHEIRELLRRMLETLAPDVEVQEALWFKKQGDTGVTRRQRVRYILEKRGVDSNVMQVAEDIESIGKLTSDVYGRASDAAHRLKSKNEAFRILRYFHAFTHDILDI